nr:alpha-glucosidase-like [Megalopta genalis]
MIRLTAIACLVGLACCGPNDVRSHGWHRNALVYQIYPRSFKDSNGDGIGDLNGITGKLEHVADIGATVLWLSPIYKSPQVDFGYDISNFTDVDPDYGTLADFDRLVARAKQLGLKVLMDFVPNHSSHLHPWFRLSELRRQPYDEYYVWRDGKIVNGTRKPPNNWLSTFQGSAWKWSETRQQYYLHQFAAGQPDLNYRSQALDREMKNVLEFWLDRGVDGFRIDAINHMFEDVRLLDEPRANRSDLPVDDYDSLIHLYTKDQRETYQVLGSWRKLLDDHANATGTDDKLILTEAYTTRNLTIDYYDAGSNVPFNFAFITDLNGSSSAADFAGSINGWLTLAPNLKGVPNWVVGNHDNHRVATRFGSRRADQITMLSLFLPGVSVVYNGDEIGMVDRNFTYSETVDPAGCNAGPLRYHLKSRDPERTPFQWDNSTSAGFSSSRSTWLPVHDNYRTVNLAAEKPLPLSNYRVFKDMAALKRTPLVEFGDAAAKLVARQVLAVVRKYGTTVGVLLINFSDGIVAVDLAANLVVPPTLRVYTASVSSNVSPGSSFASSKVVLPGAATILLTAQF